MYSFHCIGTHNPLTRKKISFSEKNENDLAPRGWFFSVVVDICSPCWCLKLRQTCCPMLAKYCSLYSLLTPLTHPLGTPTSVVSSFAHSFDQIVFWPRRRFSSAFPFRAYEAAVIPKRFTHGRTAGIFERERDGAPRSAWPLFPAVVCVRRTRSTYKQRKKKKKKRKRTGSRSSTVTTLLTRNGDAPFLLQPISPTKSVRRAEGIVAPLG